MKPILLIFVEEDFLLPVAYDADGRTFRLSDADDCRIPLYFYSSDNVVDYGWKYKTEVDKGSFGYYGDFYRKVAAGAKASVFGKELPYFDLLRLSCVTNKLSGFFLRETAVNDKVIPTGFVFAESLEFPARKAFMERMMGEGFLPVSFSETPTDMVLSYVVGSRAEEFAFGDYIAVITSAANSLRLTTCVYDGETWLSGGDCKVVSGIGDAPLKQALVRCVVDTVDKNRGFLSADGARRQREYLHQMVNADKWFSLYKGQDGDFDIGDFRYSHDPDASYSCHIPRNLLESIFGDTVNKAMSEIGSYVRAATGKNSLKLTILCGAAFDDDKFASMVKAALDNVPGTCLQSYALQEVYRKFPADWDSSAENFSEYDKIVARERGRLLAVTAWVASASKIRQLWTDMESSVPYLKEVVAADERRMNEMLGMADTCLATSRFADAREKLVAYSLPGDATKSAKADVRVQLAELDDLQMTFQSVMSVNGARHVVERINRLAEDAAELMKTVNGFQDVLTAKKEQITFFEAHYDEYLELKRKFNRAVTVPERREIVEKMRDLTKEPLPELRLNPVKVLLNAEVVTEKAGLFKKIRKLVCRAKVDKGEVLPCDAVVDISTRVQITANMGDARCIAVPFAKGQSVLEAEFSLPDKRLEDGKPIYVYLFAGADVLDKNAIESQHIIVKL